MIMPFVKRSIAALSATLSNLFLFLRFNLINPSEIHYRQSQLLSEYSFSVHEKKENIAVMKISANVDMINMNFMIDFFIVHLLFLNIIGKSVQTFTAFEILRSSKYTSTTNYYSTFSSSAILFNHILIRIKYDLDPS